MERKLISSKTLPKLTSYHNPILLQLEEEENLGPIPFRFFPLWIEQEGFKEIVIKDWSTPVIGSPSFVWEQKLKATKFSLKEWIKNPSITPSILGRETVQHLNDLHMDMENKYITNLKLEKAQYAQLSSFHSFLHEE